MTQTFNTNIELNNIETENSIHDASTINRLTSSNTKFKITHWNCNSVKNKANELKQFLKENNPDVISLNEIKCDEKWANEILNIDNYNLIYKCRNNGGVAFLIRQCHVFTEIRLRNCFNSNFDEEVIGFNIILNKTTHSFFSYYNPPNKKLNYELFEHIQKQYANFVIMGDFNAKCSIHGCNKSNKNGDIMETILFNLDGLLLNTNYLPTFHIINSNNRPDYHSFIDMIYGSPMYINMIESYRILETFDSMQESQYHSAIELVLNINIDKNYSRSTLEIPKSQEAATTLNIDELLVFITSKINIAITNNIPLSNHSDNPRSPLPSHILRKIKARNRLQRIYRKNRTQINRDNYYKTQEEIKDNIKSFNSNKWRKFTEKIGNNPLSTKSYWRRINRIMKKKTIEFLSKSSSK